MPNIKISKEAFIGQLELSRLYSFLGDQGFKTFMKSLNNTPGVFLRDGIDTNFKITLGTISNQISMPANSTAADKDMNLIVLKAFQNISPFSTTGFYGLRISYQTDNLEEGTVVLSNSGTMVGNGTSFLSTLRGQVRDNANKVVFYSPSTNSYYNDFKFEVITVNSNTLARIEGRFESVPLGVPLKYAVIGTFTPGYTPPIEEEKIYEFDSCLLEYIPLPALPDSAEDLAAFIPEEGKYFFIAALHYDEPTQTVSQLTDTRYWFHFTNYAPESVDKLARLNNLSDLGNKETALMNLGFTTVGRNIVKGNPPSATTYLRINANGTISFLQLPEFAGGLDAHLKNLYLNRDKHLSDLLDVAQARNNLNVYSKSDVYSKEETYPTSELYTKTEIEEIEDYDATNILTSGYTTPDVDSYFRFVKNIKTVTMHMSLRVATGASNTIVHPSNPIPERFRPVVPNSVFVGVIVNKLNELEMVFNKLRVTSNGAIYIINPSSLTATTLQLQLTATWVTNK